LAAAVGHIDEDWRPHRDVDGSTKNTDYNQDRQRYQCSDGKVGHATGESVATGHAPGADDVGKPVTEQRWPLAKYGCWPALGMTADQVIVEYESLLIVEALAYFPATEVLQGLVQGKCCRDDPTHACARAGRTNVLNSLVSLFCSMATACEPALVME
jgi:hypothetical protein